MGGESVASSEYESISLFEDTGVCVCVCLKKKVYTSAYTVVGEMVSTVRTIDSNGSSYTTLCKVPLKPSYFSLVSYIISWLAEGYTCV